jgi:hypothetical protein
LKVKSYYQIAEAGKVKYIFLYYNKMERPVSTVLIEAIVIGVMNLVIIMALCKLKTGIPDLTIYFIAGFLIHIIFEYTGGNKWWCTQTYNL